VLRNDFAFFEASICAGLVDAYAVPINWHSTASEAAYVLRDCDAKCVRPQGLPSYPLAQGRNVACSTG
jgi:hypothetical protein